MDPGRGPSDSESACNSLAAAAAGLTMPGSVSEALAIPELLIEALAFALADPGGSLRSSSSPSATSVAGFALATVLGDGLDGPSLGELVEGTCRGGAFALAGFDGHSKLTGGALARRGGDSATWLSLSSGSSHGARIGGSQGARTTLDSEARAALSPVLKRRSGGALAEIGRVFCGPSAASRFRAAVDTTTASSELVDIPSDASSQGALGTLPAALCPRTLVLGGRDGRGLLLLRRRGGPAP